MSRKKSRLYGQWGKAKKILDRVERKSQQFSEQQAADLAKKAHRMLLDHIAKADLDMPPLAAATVRRKKSSRPWKHTGELARKIRIQRLAGSKASYRVGPVGHHTGSGMAAAKLAGILEEGYAPLGIPPRPLFAPTYQELRAMDEEIAKMVLVSYKQFIWE